MCTLAAGRLRVSDIPRRSTHRSSRVFPARRHSFADDVHRRLPALDHRVPGGARRPAATTNVQRACDEFHSGRDSARYTTLRTRTEGHLQARLSPVHR